jgi:hypothetical protein
VSTLACVALLATAFWLGWLASALRAKSSVDAIAIERRVWAALCKDLHSENGKLRCQQVEAPTALPAPTPDSAPIAVPAPADDETTPSPGIERGNALRQLRKRLDVSRENLAKRLGVPLAGIAQVERTPLRLLEVDTVRQFVEALECRLDVVAQHIDGEAIWLSDEQGAS